jgi:hypothetical protein
MCQQVSSIWKEEPSAATELPKEQWSNFHNANLVTFNDVILANFLTVRQMEAGNLKGTCSTTSRLLTATNVFSVNAQICGQPWTTARL